MAALAALALLATATEAGAGLRGSELNVAEGHGAGDLPKSPTNSTDGNGSPWYSPGNLFGLCRNVGPSSKSYLTCNNAVVTPPRYDRNGDLYCPFGTFGVYAKPTDPTDPNSCNPSMLSALARKNPNDLPSGINPTEGCCPPFRVETSCVQNKGVYDVWYCGGVNIILKLLGLAGVGGAGLLVKKRCEEVDTSTAYRDVADRDGAAAGALVAQGGDASL